MFLISSIGCQVPKNYHTENPIVLENQKPGTRDWMLTNSQTDTCEITEPYNEIFLCRSKPIEGYCSATSIMAGEVLKVFVSTDPPSPFMVDIFRMGYYQGKGARKISSLGPFQGKNKKVPEDGKNNVRECTWEPSFELEVGTHWTSGVYLGKMTATNSGLQSYIVFIVKDDRPADFLFQCSDLTWQAYNRWPEWRSLYDWTCTMPEHWIFEGTNMEKGDVIQDLVGWEYHGYPLGDIKGIQVLAEGKMFEPKEGNLYAATYYETPNGNFVFNAATCWWNMLLSSPPGFAYPQNHKGLFTDRPVDFRKNDARVQKMTQNMLERIAEQKF